MWDSQSGINISKIDFGIGSRISYFDHLHYTLIVIAADLSVKVVKMFPTAEDVFEEAKRSIPICLSIAQRQLFRLQKERPTWCRSKWPMGRPILGVTVRSTNGGANSVDGVVVSAIQQDGPAERAGLQIGDVITRVDATAVSSADLLATLVRQYSVGTEVSITFRRKDQVHTISVTLSNEY